MGTKTRKRRKLCHHSMTEVETPAIVRLWMLRCLVPLYGYRRLVQREFIDDDGVARAIGLKDGVDKQGDEFDQGRLISELRGFHREIEHVAEDCHLPETLGRNIRHLAKLIGLDETEQAILAFVVMVHSDKNLKTTVGYLGETLLSEDQVIKSSKDGDVEVTATMVDSGLLGRWINSFGEQAWCVKKIALKPA